MAQLVARESHNLKVASSILALGIFFFFSYIYIYNNAPVAQLVALWSYVPTVQGSSPCWSNTYVISNFNRQKRIYNKAAVAQLVERQTEDLKVPGSIPGGGIVYIYIFFSIYIYICIYI